MSYQKFQPQAELLPFVECYFIWKGEAKESVDVQSPLKKALNDCPFFNKHCRQEKTLTYYFNFADRTCAQAYNKKQSRLKTEISIPIGIDQISTSCQC